ncbi:hypothetical protein ABE237_29235 [Brevibacillus formosus]|uniref:hypothetical protein n=1 Tax=Brevibacillus formosus TaxID=54913 RepID=UPI0018CCCDDA|nr:hypothetical protein [Brevibacillus formosus]MBG9942317.1 hypothetical protein [Brevibacillus formosus]
MSKFPARYTQLPNFEHEYLEIINRIQDGMYKSEVEKIISEIKGSILKNRYKHRTHLENVGFFTTGKDGEISLSEITMKIKGKKISIKEGLLLLIIQNQELIEIFRMVDSTRFFDGEITKRELAKSLHNKHFPNTPEATIDRYLNQLISLYQIVGHERIRNALPFIQEQHYNSLKYNKVLAEIEKFYISEVRDYGEVLALEKISLHLKDKYFFSEDDLLKFWETFYLDEKIKYKFTLITLPIWSTNYKGIKIIETIFTHLIIEF